MRTRKTLAILSAGLILACCGMLYIIMDLTFFPPGQGSKLSINDVSVSDINICKSVINYNLW